MSAHYIIKKKNPHPSSHYCNLRLESNVPAANCPLKFCTVNICKCYQKFRKTANGANYRNKMRRACVCVCVFFKTLIYSIAVRSPEQKWIEKGKKELHEKDTWSRCGGKKMIFIQMEIEKSSKACRVLVAVTSVSSGNRR